MVFFYLLNKRSRNTIKLNMWHKLKLFNHKSLVKMTVNMDRSVSNSEIKWPKGYHFNSSMFVGSLKQSLDETLPTVGLDGAIQKLEIFYDDYLLNDRTSRVYLNDLRRNALELANLREYVGFPCNHSRCQNGGVCIPNANKFYCNLN